MATPDLTDANVQMSMVRAYVLLTSYLRTLPVVEQQIIDVLARNYSRRGQERAMILDEIREMVFEKEWRKEPPEHYKEVA